MARSGLQGVSAARQRPLHGTSPQRCPPWFRTPSACCAHVGPCGALMRLRAQWRGLVWRGWPAAAFKVCPLRASHPHCALRGTSPQRCTPWFRAPSACCARVGLCGALMRLHVQWRGLVWRGWPAAAFKVCPLRASPPYCVLRYRRDSPLYPVSWVIMVLNAIRLHCARWLRCFCCLRYGLIVRWYTHGDPDVPRLR